MSSPRPVVLLIVAAPSPIDDRLLERPLAGRLLVDHVAAALQPLRAGRVERTLPNQSADWAGADVLMVNAGVWLSPLTLERLLARVSGEPLGVMSGNDVIAVYLPSPADTAGAFDGEHLRRPAAVIEGHELDPDLPPVRVANAVDFAELERTILYSRACAALRAGVWIRDPRDVAIRGTLRCGARVEIDLNVIFEGDVTLGDDVWIGPHAVVKNASIGARSRVNAYSIVEGATVGADTFVGPYGRIRPGSTVGDAVQIGNFVEVKNAELGSGTRVNHLSFVGDAVVGRHVTLGAGTVTCNHDGVGFATTRIEDDAYIGSGTELVAPVTIGSGATIGAGSTITEDAPAGKLSLARARQVTVSDWKRGRRKPRGA